MDTGVPAYTVGEVARLAHVSVRTLHHYDELGLLTPSARSDAGYRLYTHTDLEQLQQVLLYRALGLGLRGIRDLMADPSFDRLEALRAQRRSIEEQTRRLGAMLSLIDKTLAAEQGDAPVSQEEMFEVFGDFDPSEHEEEVKDRWGATDAYKESARRAGRYTKADWQHFNEESEEIGLAIAALMDEGVPADHPRAMDAVERHRLQIDRWFYPCSREMHAELGKMYVVDPRFAATYEKIHPGMARYVCDAITANLRRGCPAE